jgi:hypothetical protein
MSKLNDTLDSILRKYYHKNTPPTEKEVCLNVFKRKCASNNINADNYIKEFERKNAPKTEKKDPFESKSQWKYESASWDDIFRRASQQGSRWERQDNQRKQRDEESEKRRQEYYEKNAPPNMNSYAYCAQYAHTHGEIKDCIYEVKLDRIIIQGLRMVGTRWAIENFVFYTGNDPKKTIKELKKYDIFKFTSNGRRYSGNLNISRIWGMDLHMKEHEIY